MADHKKGTESLLSPIPEKTWECGENHSLHFLLNICRQICFKGRLLRGCLCTGLCIPFSHLEICGSNECKVCAGLFYMWFFGFFFVFLKRFPRVRLKFTFCNSKGDFVKWSGIKMSLLFASNFRGTFLLAWSFRVPYPQSNECRKQQWVLLPQGPQN